MDLASQAAAGASAGTRAAAVNAADVRAYREARAARLRNEINVLAKLDPAIAFGWSIGLVGLTQSECMSRTLINRMDLKIAPRQPQQGACSSRQLGDSPLSPPDTALSDSPLSDCVSLLNTPELAMLMPTLLPPKLTLPQAVKATHPAWQTCPKVSLRLAGCSSSRLLG